ncbi:hypothetical protein Ancab_024245 [Ancistrocladus abbreviatus]
MAEEDSHMSMSLCIAKLMGFSSTDTGLKFPEVALHSLACQFQQEWSLFSLSSGFAILSPSSAFELHTGQYFLVGLNNSELTESVVQEEEGHVPQPADNCTD